jgi:hypothetical protein
MIIIIFLYIRIRQLDACEPTKFFSPLRVYKPKPFSTTYMYELYLYGLFMFPESSSLFNNIIIIDFKFFSFL